MDASAPKSLSFEEREPHERGFGAYFDSHIKPKLIEIGKEHGRAASTDTFRIILATTAVAGVAAGLLAVYGQYEPALFFLLGAFITWVLYAFSKTTELIRRANEKQRVIFSEVGNFVGGVKYDDKGPFPFDGFQPLFPHSKCNAREVFSGTHNDHNWWFAKVKIEPRDSDEHYGPTFKGYCLAIELPMTDFPGFSRDEETSIVKLAGSAEMIWHPKQVTFEFHRNWSIFRIGTELHFLSADNTIGDCRNTLKLFSDIRNIVDRLIDITSIRPRPWD